MCPTDPLLFTCEVTESPVDQATVTFPSGQELDLDDDNTTSGSLPDGVAVQFQNVHVTVIDMINIYNYTLSLSIDNTSLLNGGMIICNSRIGEQDMAGCPVAGKFNVVGALHNTLFLSIFCADSTVVLGCCPKAHRVQMPVSAIKTCTHVLLCAHAHTHVCVINP